MNTKPSRSWIVWLLIFFEALLSFGAIVSGAMLMFAPDGSLLGMPVSVMHGGPFRDFFIPGMILFLFLGVYPAIVAYGVWQKPAWRWANAFNPFGKYHWSWAGSLAAGAIVWVWLLVELIWVDYSILHAIYFIWGGLIFFLAVAPPVRRYLKAA